MASANAYDSVVVGAGPAGATAAYLLAKKGLKILVLDKKAFPRPKLCGGLLTWKSMLLIRDILRIAPAELRSRGIIQCQSRKYAVRNRHRKSFYGQLEFPFHFVDRSTYDGFWLRHALRAGAAFEPGQKVVQIDGPCRCVTTSNGRRYRGRFVLAADGAGSRLRTIIAKRGRLDPRWRRQLALGVEIAIVRAARGNREDFPSIYYGFVPWGYAWCFPGPETRIYGMAALNSKSGKKIRTCFAEFLDSQSVGPAARESIAGHYLPYGNYALRPGFRRLLLLGDACGLADPLLGEGIFYAHRSGQLAARAVLSAFRNPGDLVPIYSRLLTENIFPDLKYAGIGRRIAFSLPLSWYYYFFSGVLRTNRRIFEETVQGRRSFRWLRPADNAGGSIKQSL
jgi:geranylgeranyl reductase family protein